MVSLFFLFSLFSLQLLSNCSVEKFRQGFFVSSCHLRDFIGYVSRYRFSKSFPNRFWYWEPSILLGKWANGLMSPGHWVKEINCKSSHGRIVNHSNWRWIYRFHFRPRSFPPVISSVAINIVEESLSWCFLDFGTRRGVSYGYTGKINEDPWKRSLSQSIFQFSKQGIPSVVTKPSFILLNCNKSQKAVTTIAACTPGTSSDYLDRVWSSVEDLTIQRLSRL